MSIDLNALAAQLASQLAAAPLPPREGQEGAKAPGEPPVLAAPPRGVRYTDGDVRLGDFLDHTLLRPDATMADIDRLCGEARDHRLASVCVNSVWVADAARLLRGSSVTLVSVIGFPSGAVPSAVKAAEAALAVQHGAREVDVVVPLGALRGGLWDDVERDVAAVVEAAGGALVKAIVESALLTPMALVKACMTVRDGGAHYVKTSTGFHSAGGATPETVALMRLAVGDSMGVKASGGIRDGATALAMLAAGATRLGTSAGAAMAEVRGPGPRRLAGLIAEPVAGAAAAAARGQSVPDHAAGGAAPSLAAAAAATTPAPTTQPTRPPVVREPDRAAGAPPLSASPTPAPGPALPSAAERWRPLGTPIGGVAPVPPVPPVSPVPQAPSAPDRTPRSPTEPPSTD